MKEQDQNILSKIKRYRNPYHCNNCYLNFDIEDIKENNMENIFQTIALEENTTLQVMISSKDIHKINVLKTNGFKKVRSCYELDVTKNDLLAINSKRCDFQEARLGSKIYDSCAKLLFKHYVETHKHINPLTSTYIDFSNDLPDKVLYYAKHDNIIHCSFVKENEIAYVCSEEIETFMNFAHSIVEELFKKFTLLSFEADDVDPVAKVLKNLFKINCQESYDTWLFKI